MRENAIRCDKPPVRALRKDDYAKSTLKRPICLSRVLAVSVLSLSGCMKWDTVSFSRVDEIFSSCYTSGIEHLFYSDSSLTAASRHADVIEKNKKPKRCPNQDKVRISCFWWRRMDSNHRSRRQQIYSLPPLATRELLHMKLWSWWTDSNPRPADYKSAALPTELHQQNFSLAIVANLKYFVNTVQINGQCCVKDYNTYIAIE